MKLLWTENQDLNLLYSVIVTINTFKNVITKLLTNLCIYIYWLRFVYFSSEIKKKKKGKEKGKVSWPFLLFCFLGLSCFFFFFFFLGSIGKKTSGSWFSILLNWRPLPLKCCKNIIKLWNPWCDYWFHRFTKYLHIIYK